MAERRLAEFRTGLDLAPAAVRGMAEAAMEQAVEESLGPAPDVEVRILAAETDVEREKGWLLESTGERRPTALIVVHDNAVEMGPNDEFGTYDLFVPEGLDDRDVSFVHDSLRDAIVNARMSGASLDRASIDALVRVPRPRSVTVTEGAERQSIGGISFILPVAFMTLLFMGVMTGGQTMLTSTIEEKSSRVVEVLLSAVSPMQLMAGKLLGNMAVSLVAIGLYLAIGLVLLSSFSLFGLLDPWLILYLLIFFVIGFLVLGSLMMAVGAAVNDMSEAQSLQMPLIMVLITPMILWPAVSRDPNSVLAVTISFLPPINSFGMLLRMASSQPPPYWQVWLSILIGALSIVGALWVAAKVFRIGLLMYGKPPDFKTLLKWVRAA